MLLSLLIWWDQIGLGGGFPMQKLHDAFANLPCMLLVQFFANVLIVLIRHDASPKTCNSTECVGTCFLANPNVCRYEMTQRREISSSKLVGQQFLLFDKVCALTESMANKQLGQGSPDCTHSPFWLHFSFSKRWLAFSQFRFFMHNLQVNCKSQSGSIRKWSQFSLQPYGHFSLPIWQQHGHASCLCYLLVTTFTFSRISSEPYNLHQSGFTISAKISGGVWKIFISQNYF